MTQTEYEQKKRECLDEFCKRYRIEEPSEQNIESFNWIFDRAYALGKQKEAITQEDIEKASVEYADKTAKQYEVCNSEFVQEIMVAFEQGANYALGKQEKNAEETQSPMFKKGDRVKMKYNVEYTVSAVELITDKYMYGLIADNKTWHGMELESKLRKVENK